MTPTPDDAHDQLPGEPAPHEDPQRQDGDDPLRGSRTSGFWAAVVGLGVVLLLLIIFIAQNTRKTTVSFLSWDGQVPVAVALLIAALAGLSLAGLAGSLRILQLRRRVRHARR
ncbi:MAG: lipopolysaccharide assembly protein LapA domain-containing protein [Nocardioides sp.]|nr:lipopolysaccharide assembly protein LapA domain-containing protein [Nocardioides sp.]